LIAIRLKYNKPRNWILLNDKHFNVTAHYVVKKKKLTIYRSKGVYPPNLSEIQIIYWDAISEFLSDNLKEINGWHYYFVPTNGQKTKEWTNYKDYLKSDEWYKIRAQKIEEADNRCQLCYKLGKLQVHHRTYKRIFNEKLSDLIVLCKNCHKIFHNVSKPV